MCNSHGQDSLYFLGWQEYEKTPYDEVKNPSGIIQMGLAENQIPIGIDCQKFIHALELPEVQAHIKELKEKISGRKVILGVDRLDMIKGIPQKILAFEKFLEDNCDIREKVVLLQIAVPSRTEVTECMLLQLYYRELIFFLILMMKFYSIHNINELFFLFFFFLTDKKLRSQVHETVGRINGRFGTLATVPIHHLDCSLDFNVLCAFVCYSCLRELHNLWVLELSL
ncbi:hypothetical protein AQUCO_01000468v1 [Aquilegia coerulea]|uniref:Trehalose-6-phosphate synthase n=1 Tax=Aquilegia coerulea TaxID=218851 RepID=A0A2G5EA28_AQUCA|nr:hypothetical protein AQUCO_01000468v1 [Aquilegia coerulea]